MGHALQGLRRAEPTRRQAALIDHLRDAYPAAGTILEIGSGTGQDACCFAAHLPHLRWQPSDLARYLPVIRSTMHWSSAPNLLAPVCLDVTQRWPSLSIVGAFTSNTVHVLPWRAVEAMYAGVAAALPAGGRFCVYGPFSYRGQFRDASNRQFDAMIRARHPERGVRDFERVAELAGICGFVLEADLPVPSHNRLLIWRRARPLHVGRDSAAYCAGGALD